MTVFPATLAKADMHSLSMYGTPPLTLEEEVYGVFRVYGVIDDLLINGDATALNAAGVTGGGTSEEYALA